MISKEKLIVRISGFGKNSVSKFWKNKKLNVLDMGYTLIEVQRNMRLHNKKLALEENGYV